MLILVSCGHAKRDVPAPARELYTGTYHRAALALALAMADGVSDRRVYILSALHGLLDCDRVVAPYDLRMGSPGSVTAYELARQAVALGVRMERSVLVLGGAEYVKLARTVWPHADAFADKMPRGRRGLGWQIAHMSQTAKRLRAADNDAT